MNHELSPFDGAVFWAVIGQTSAIAPAKPVLPNVTLSHAIEAVVESKRQCGRRPKYVHRLGKYLTMFARGRESIPLAHVTLELLEDWFTTRNEKPVCRSSNIGLFSALLSFGVRKGWISDNPARRLEKPFVDRKPPKILSVHEAKKVLQLAFQYGHHMPPKRGRWLAYVILGAFVGLRPTEILRTTWGSYRPDDGLWIVDAEASKTRRRRVIRLEPNAILWLNLAKSMSRLEGYNFIGCRRFNRAIAKKLRLPGWPQDYLRHSAASYLLAKHRNAGLVAGLLGNSASILTTHYMELVSPRECEAYWNLTPEAVLSPIAIGRLKFQGIWKD